MRILLVGGSGLIGSHLLPFLQKEGHEVTLLTRKSPSWDPEQGVVDREAIEDYGAIVNLSGETIVGRWTTVKKNRIRESRVQTTTLLADTIKILKKPPQVFINASAVGYYGSRGNEKLTEESSCGSGFLAEVCRDWEGAAFLCKSATTRVLCLRLGAVLSVDGGMLAKLLPLFRLGLGGRISLGEQWMSWIAMADLLRLIAFLLTQSTIEGVVNAVSPYPIKNKDFTKILAESLRRPAFLSLPTFLLRLFFGEMAESTMLASQRAFPKRAIEEGFYFEYSELPVKGI
ncbi:MAG: hypothetical protein JWO53_780 [Chlamydiia bacterium]|nr:hypothetical protein [Chlamydiia bacterium]